MMLEQTMNYMEGKLDAVQQETCIGKERIETVQADIRMWWKRRVLSAVAEPAPKSAPQPALRPFPQSVVTESAPQPAPQPEPRSELQSVVTEPACDGTDGRREATSVPPTSRRRDSPRWKRVRKPRPGISSPNPECCWGAIAGIRFAFSTRHSPSARPTSGDRSHLLSQGADPLDLPPLLWLLRGLLRSVPPSSQVVGRPTTRSHLSGRSGTS